MNQERQSRRIHGSAMIEFALLLPLLLTLVFGAVDFGRALQFNNIVSTISREGGSLAARTTSSDQDIITAVTLAAAPLDMSANGIVYITEVMGRADGRGTVQGQSRSVSGNMSLKSKLYPSCPGWTGGACAVPTPAPVVTVSGLALQNGELVHVVEVAYNFEPLAGFVWLAPGELYCQTVL
jgi:Flp pilus assembly protein TadG